MQTALRVGVALAEQARQATCTVATFGANKLRRLIAADVGRTRDFGVPLEKDFAAFVVSRDIPYLPEFDNYSGLSATVGDNITEVVIGAADRITANAGELGGTSAGRPRASDNADLASPSFRSRSAASRPDGATSSRG